MKNVRVSKKKYFEALENVGLYHEDGTIYPSVYCRLGAIRL